MLRFRVPLGRVSPVSQPGDLKTCPPTLFQPPQNPIVAQGLGLVNTSRHYGRAISYMRQQLDVAIRAAPSQRTMDFDVSSSHGHRSRNSRPSKWLTSGSAGHHNCWPKRVSIEKWEHASSLWCTDRDFAYFRSVLSRGRTETYVGSVRVRHGMTRTE